MPQMKPSAVGSRHASDFAMVVVQLSVGRKPMAGLRRAILSLLTRIKPFQPVLFINPKIRLNTQFS
jgi:hypothetical protein